MTTDDELREQLASYARKAYDRGLVGGTGGNFSVRLSGNRMAITASGLSLGETSIGNLLNVQIGDYSWEQVGGCVPSKEYRFHADTFRLRPDVGAVLHVHPPFATAYAAKSRDIPMVTDAAFKQPPMPRVCFAPSGSEELQRYVEEAVESNPGCKALLMEKHGILVLGTDVLSAYNTADLIEELAKIAYLANRL